MKTMNPVQTLEYLRGKLCNKNLLAGMRQIRSEKLAVTREPTQGLFCYQCFNYGATKTRQPLNNPQYVLLR